MEFKTVKIEKPENINFILGMAHFIKTVEDIHETLVNTVPGIEFGVAFCEGSPPALLRYSGTSDDMLELAKQNGMNLAAGHAFIIFLGNCFPINVLHAVQRVPEVVRIFCATANPTEVIIAETDQGRGIMGVIDGIATTGLETEADIADRKALLRTFGYKL
jgi:hypothetical protein